ncbi:hypothetical protein AAVH_30607, partial [Aphelenchoides avenae]
CKFEVDDYMDVAITMARGGPGGRFNGPPRGGRMVDRFSGEDRFGTGSFLQLSFIAISFFFYEK